MTNKLDPRQYNPYALNSPSGNLSFEEGVDFFNCHLLENLTGDFNIFGSLQVNSGKVVFSDSSNLIEDNNNSVLNSTNSSVSGSNNILINSNQSVLLGSNNTIIGGEQNVIRDSDNSAIVFGSNVVNKNTGSAILADGNVSRLKESVRDNALTIDFSSGTFVLNDLFVDGSVYLTGDVENDGNLTVKAGSSGVFEGGVSISGIALLSGSPLQNLENLTGASGQLQHNITGASGLLTTNIKTTGSNLSSTIELTGINSVNYTNSISGILTDKFDGNEISGNLITAQYLVIDSGRFIPSNFDSTGISGQLSFDHQYFYICTGDDGWGRIAFDNSWGGPS
jgi:hypothetical protein